MTRGIPTKGGPEKTEAEKQPSKEAATTTRTMPSSVQAATKQEAKKKELIADCDEAKNQKEMIADWDEMYVGVSMMLSLSKYLELSC
jgi:hypothetical protein